MDIVTAFLLVFSLITGTSYAWGMRGTTIGGEKGAMLPGAIIGLLIAYFSKILIAQEHFYIFAALGAVSMYIGGSMTYGETLGLSMNKKPAENMKKGLVALFIKGFLWFGLFGAIFTTGINAVCYTYSLLELMLIFIITPGAAVGGYFLFNKPLKPKENRFPKLYFSKTRQESWGALLGAFLVLTVFAIIKLNAMTLIFSFSCAVFGGVGWILGQLMQIYSIHYAGNSHSKLLGLFSHKNGIDSWKIMECVLGAFGGLGAAIGFLLSYGEFKSVLFNLEKNNGLIPYNKTIALVLFVLWCLLLAGDMVHYFIKKPITKKELKKQLKRKQITQEQYAVKRLKAVTAVPRGYYIYDQFTEKSEPVLYSAIPFMLICIGSRETALITSFFLIFLVLAQEIALEKTLTKRFDLLVKIPLAVLATGIFITQTVLSFDFTAVGTFLMYTVGYEALTVAWLAVRSIRLFRRNIKKSDETYSKKELIKLFSAENKAVIKVHCYFVFCILLSALLLK